MEKVHSFTSTEIETLAKRIKREIFVPQNTTKTTIFLCGAALGNSETIRSKVATILLSPQTRKFGDREYLYKPHDYDLVYPEDIFEELLFSKKGLDLLSLEGLLAKSVDVLIIIPESPGSFAELGAFANNTDLRKKIICIIEERFKKHKSFINQGPVKLVKQTGKDKIVFVDKNDLVNSLSNNSL